MTLATVTPYLFTTSEKVIETTFEKKKIENTRHVIESIRLHKTASW